MTRPLVLCRMMRLIEDIIATQDGKHALALCTDGGVLYFRNDFIEFADDAADERKFETSTCCTLVEFNTLQRQSDGPWALKRVGKRGSVLLLRAQNVPTEAPLALGHTRTIISVKPLTGPLFLLTRSQVSTIVTHVFSLSRPPEEANGEVADTKLPVGAKPWNTCGFYAEVCADSDWPLESSLDIDTTDMLEANEEKVSNGRPPIKRKSPSAVPKSNIMHYNIDHF